MDEEKDLFEYLMDMEGGARKRKRRSRKKTRSRKRRSRKKTRSRKRRSRKKTRSRKRRSRKKTRSRKRRSRKKTRSRKRRSRKKTRSRKRSRSRKSKKSCRVGSKAQVWHGTCDKTSGGLTKKDLMKNKHGNIVSKKKHAIGKRLHRRYGNHPAVVQARKNIAKGVYGNRKRSKRRSSKRKGKKGNMSKLFDMYA